MGVKNLWQILAPVCERKSLWELHDKVLAIDLSCWVCDSQNVLNTQQPRMYLRNLFFRTSCLLLLGVKPVFVLEGRAPTLKYDTMSQRVQQRTKNKKQSSSSDEENAKVSQCTRLERNKGSRSRLNSILKQCEALLAIMGVSCVQSFGEAEALCAQLNESGLVHGCITQDGDCFLYGAQTVYRNFTIGRQGSTSYSVEEYKMIVIEKKLALSRQKLIALSLLCGCDYNDKGVLGVGKEAALNFLEHLKDDEILPRLKQWRTDPRYECLETEYAALGNTCSKCNHTGKLQKHAKSGCKDCATKFDCIKTTDMHHLSQKDPGERKCIIAELVMRRKALQDENFPSQAIIDEFLYRQPLPKFDVRWKQPDIVSFINYAVKLLNWTELYAVEKFIPLVTRWQVHNLRNDGRNSDQAALPFMPCKIIKKRVLKSVHSFEVEWKDHHGLLCNIEVQHGITTEPQEMFRTAYPDLVEKYMEEEAKSRKGKTTGRKLKRKTASVKTYNCQCKENEEHNKYTQQSHMCTCMKSSSKSDVSEIQSFLGNLDISSEDGKGNLENLSHKDAIHMQSCLKIEKKQSTLTFNYLCDTVAQGTENNVQQMNQKRVMETNLESGIKLERETHSAHALNGDKGIGAYPCNTFLNSEVCAQISSVKAVELVNEKLPFGEPERKGILEEYDCLDLDDEIMDMSSIIENIVRGPNNTSVQHN